MTLKEVATLCSTIRKTTFAWRNETPEDFDETIKVWHEYLEDEPFDIAMKAAKDFIRENSKPPAIADIYLPYKESIENKREKNKRLRKLYYDTISEYPCYKDTPEMQNEWMRICGNDISKAERFERQLIEYVRSCEMQRIDPMPFEEYMKGVKAIE